MTTALQCGRSHDAMRTLKLIYRFCRGLLRLTADTVYDVFQYLRWSPLSGPPRSACHLDAYVTMNYHRLEKGLSFRDSRPRFGRNTIDDLIAQLRLSDKHGERLPARIAVSTLVAYQEAQDAQSRYEKLDAFLAERGALRSDKLASDAEGGFKFVSRDEIHAAAMQDMAPFFESRHSVRHFDDREVDMDLIRRAVDMARFTPSVCNRQATRVHVLSNAKDKISALNLQNGNRGFQDQIDKVIVVTSDLRSFVSSGERYQSWIDGGMFAMSLVYALHSLGLGTCCLNWSVDWFTDKRLRRAISLPPYERVIMLIAVGHLPEQFRVARSMRSPADELIVVH